MNREEQKEFLRKTFKIYKENISSITADQDREWLAYFAGMAIGKVTPESHMTEEAINELFSEGLAE